MSPAPAPLHHLPSDVSGDPGPAPQTDSAPPASAFPPLQPLAWRDPFVWLLLGWRDFIRAPGIGLFYGGCFAAMGWALMKVFEQAPAYTLALSAGFLLMGPLLCLGLYHASRSLEAGEQPDFGQSLLAWDSHTGPLAIFGFVLLVLEMLWGRASLVIFAVSFDGMPDFKGSLMALLNPDNLEFIIAYVGVGAVFAGLIFAVCVISMPMLLDRDTDAITAGLTSLRLVLTQPGVMLLWGALLTVLVVLALLPWFLGLLVVGPVTGHATWHAYRAALGPRAAPDAEAGQPV
jgi:uncharacterized membrane protein